MDRKGTLCLNRIARSNGTGLRGVTEIFHVWTHNSSNFMIHFFELLLSSPCSITSSFLYQLQTFSSRSLSWRNKPSWVCQWGSHHTESPRWRHGDAIGHVCYHRWWRPRLCPAGDFCDHGDAEVKMRPPWIIQVCVALCFVVIFINRNWPTLTKWNENLLCFEERTTSLWNFWGENKILVKLCISTEKNVFGFQRFSVYK